jgi:poly(A) polymerase
VRKLGAPLSRELLRLSWARHHAGDAAAAPDAAFEAALADADRLVSKRFPVFGRDALALGVAEGPKLGRLLDEVEEWWAERDFEPAREACLARLRDLVAAERA